MKRSITVALGSTILLGIPLTVYGCYGCYGSGVYFIRTDLEKGASRVVILR